MSAESLRDAIAQALCDQFGLPWGPDPADRRSAAAVLAARYPKACPTCKGTGISLKAQAINRAFATEALTHPEIIKSELCPDCPTIGKLLAIGEAVLCGIYEIDHPRGLREFGPFDAFSEGVAAMRAYLRAVEP